jgi:hypothetical protein
MASLDIHCTVCLTCLKGDQHGRIECRLKVNVGPPVCAVLPTWGPASEDPGSSSTAPVSVADSASPEYILSAGLNCNLACVWA